MVLASVGVQGVTWLVDQFLLAQGTPLPTTAWVVVTCAQGVALALVAVPLALFSRQARLRAVYQTWALAIGFLFLLALVRFFPRTQTQLAALTQILLALVAVSVLLVLARNRGYVPAARWRSLLPTLVVAPIVAAPWFAFGALGSPIDTILGLLAGLSLGLFAALLLDVFLFVPLAAQHYEQKPGLTFAGFSAGVTLTVLGAAFGFDGSQLLLAITLPALGFVMVTAREFAGPSEGSRQYGWLPMAGLTGLVAAAPLMFVDPSELLLLLGVGGLGDIPEWAFRAAVASLFLGWAVAIFLPRVRHYLAWSPPPRPTYAGLAVVWVGIAALYFGYGQPGFYGDQMFVILKDQADVSVAATMTGRAQRVGYVYHTLVDTANASQSNLRSLLDGMHVPYQPYYLVNALEVDADPVLGLYLSQQPEVDRILASPHLRPLSEEPPVAEGSQPAPTSPPWNITSLGADRVWQELGVTGKGIIVGQSDSGVQGNHPALQDSYRGRTEGDDYNWLDLWDHTTSPTDISGHGTHTLGTALGDGGIGLAPDAEWFACTNLVRNLGNPGLYTACMQFMLAPFPQDGDPLRDGDPSRAADVINNSWGCPSIEGCDPTSLQPAVRALRAAGIFVAASAGNEGPACGSVTDPIAIYDSAFAVGAIDPDGNVADFSSRGPVQVDGSGRVKPDLLAPGVRVLSSFPGSTYAYADGTSMASPHVVGVVALMWSAQPKLIGDIDRTEQILRETARPYTGNHSGCFEGNVPNDAYGYGTLDAYAAVKAALAIR